jgi:transposase-like protein
MNKGQFRVAKRTQNDYSLAFKLQVVDEVEKGELNQMQALRKYGIQGKATILVWLRKHGRLDWAPKASMGKKQTPNKKIKELEKKIKRLEDEKEILNTAIDIADEMLNTDIRKKYLSLLSEDTNQQEAQNEEGSQLEK